MDAYSAVAVDPAPQGRRRTRALHLLAGLVLAGLWLMHGASATTEAGCHGVPVLMSMNASAAGSGPATAALAQMHAGQQPAASSGIPALAQAGNTESRGAGSGETCLSGQPPSPGDFLIVLLASLALLGAGFSAGARLPRPPSCFSSRLRRRGPPGPVGRALLTTVGISRT